MLECVFSLCESVKSWYDLNDKNLSIIHCPQGYPSTGILIACLLKYIGAFEKAEQAYDFYCNKRYDRLLIHFNLFGTFCASGQRNIVMSDAGCDVTQ